MWYIVRFDSSRVATLDKVRSETLVSSDDPTRVKSNYIPVKTTILRQIERCPGDNDHDTWEDWCDSDIRDRYCGFPPDNEETQLPVIICAPVFRGNDLDEPVQVWPDYWDTSVSVMHGESDPGVALLSPDTV